MIALSVKQDQPRFNDEEKGTNTYLITWVLVEANDPKHCIEYKERLCNTCVTLENTAHNLLHSRKFHLLDKVFSNEIIYMKAAQ